MVLDVSRARVPGVTVTIDVVRGGGRVDLLSATTDHEGIARFGEWSLTPGVNEVRAVVGALAAATWTLEGVAPADSARMNGAFDLIGIDGDSLPFETGWAQDRYVVTSARLTIRNDTFELEMQARSVGQAGSGVRKVVGSVMRWRAGLLLLLPEGTEGRPYFGTAAVVAADGRLQLAPDSDDYWPIFSLVNDFRRVP
jgi:hypothetical protein